MLRLLPIGLLLLKLLFVLSLRLSGDSMLSSEGGESDNEDWREGCPVAKC